MHKNLLFLTYLLLFAPFCIYLTMHNNRQSVTSKLVITLQWYHNAYNGISNHQPRDCLLIHFFRYRSKKTSKLHVTGLCAWNSPVTGEFASQRASDKENISIWWHHRDNWPGITRHIGTYYGVVLVYLGCFSWVSIRIECKMSGDSFESDQKGNTCLSKITSLYQ